jgi:hypothetical protein
MSAIRCAHGAARTVAAARAECPATAATTGASHGRPTPRSPPRLRASNVSAVYRVAVHGSRGRLSIRRSGAHGRWSRAGRGEVVTASVGALCSSGLRKRSKASPTYAFSRSCQRLARPGLASIRRTSPAFPTTLGPHGEVGQGPVVGISCVRSTWPRAQVHLSQRRCGGVTVRGDAGDHVRPGRHGATSAAARQVGKAPGACRRCR